MSGSEDERELEELRTADLADVTPIFNSEDENAAVRIAYTEKFRTAMSYLRALLVKDERSERALHVTKVAVHLNPANYTVWQYRRNILQSLGKGGREELQLAADLIEMHPKNYQLWHHRWVMVEWLGADAATDELEFTAKMLQDDAKNYHAWQHRVHILNGYTLWNGSDELLLTGTMLAADVRNNSAWHHRYSTCVATTGFTLDVLHNEIAFCFDAISRVPNNESVWSYLRGVLSNDEHVTDELRQRVKQFCTSCMDEPKKRCSHLLAFVVDTLLEDSAEGKSDKEHSAQITQLLTELESMDPVRRRYWHYRRAAFDNARH